MAERVMERWRESIRQAREAKGWSRAQAAAASGFGESTVEAWETGSRNARRERLARYARALGMTATERNTLLADAGFEPEPGGPMDVLRKRRRRSATDYAEEFERYPWSFLLMDDYNDIIAWNAVAEAVAEMNFAEHFGTLGERNVVWLAATPHFEAHLLNWDDLLGQQVSFWKMAHLIRPPDADSGEQGKGAAPLLQMMMKLGEHNPAAFGRLLTLYQTVPTWAEGHRNAHPVVWRVEDGTVLRFDTVFRGWSDFDATSSYDWHPADSVTWRWLARAMEDRPSRPTDEHWKAVTPQSWNEALREFRKRLGLTQAAFGARVGLTADAVYSLERGRRRPGRETIVAIVRALQMDTVTMNFILESLGMSAEPGWYARWMTGMDVDYHPGTSHGYLGVEELSRDCERFSWPLFVFDQDCRLLGGNEGARRLNPFPLPDWHETERGPHLLQLVTDEGFRAHVENWSEVLLALVPAPAKPFLNPASTPPPAGRAFDQAVAAVKRSPGGAETLRAVLALWDENANSSSDARVTFRLRWRHEDGSLLEFDGLVTGWNRFDPFWVIDLHPGNAETWEWFERQWGPAPYAPFP